MPVYKGSSLQGLLRKAVRASGHRDATPLPCGHGDTRGMWTWGHGDMGTRGAWGHAGHGDMGTCGHAGTRFEVRWTDFSRLSDLSPQAK